MARSYQTGCMAKSGHREMRQIFEESSESEVSDQSEDSEEELEVPLP